MVKTLCAFRLLLGVDCPGCGLGRSIIALLHGRLEESVAWHPMGVVLVLGVLASPLWRRFHFSEVGQKIVSHVFLFGFFGQWIVKFFI